MNTRMEAGAAWRPMTADEAHRAWYELVEQAASKVPGVARVSDTWPGGSTHQIGDGSRVVVRTTSGEVVKVSGLTKLPSAPHWWRVGKVQRWRQEESREVAEREAREYLAKECKAGPWGSSWTKAFQERGNEIEIIDEAGYRAQGGTLVMGGGAHV